MNRQGWHMIDFIRNSLNRSLLRCSSFAILLALACLVVLPVAQAVDPPPDGGYPNFNTAEGQDALFSVTTGVNNTAIGFQALFNNTIGVDNTATGYNALVLNTTGVANTANGAFALISNTTGSFNTANGTTALHNNTIGVDNTANGFDALTNNTAGNNNTANGAFALISNTIGSNNTANGFQALFNNTTGSDNTADGQGSLLSNTTGRNNTATGQNALRGNKSGAFNIALGYNAGLNLTTGDHNIDIGNKGVAGEAKTIRIGKATNQTATFIAGISGTAVAGTAVLINDTGQLGVASSSQRFKEKIRTMGDASDVLLELRPVTFNYKQEIDPKGTPQFGLLAEEVEKVNPDLVARDDQGKAYTVRYEAVNAMLLNEFLKEYRKDQEQEASITQLRLTVTRQQKEFQSAIAQQQKEVKTLTASLREQALQIQKMSKQLEVSKSVPPLVAGNQ